MEKGYAVVTREWKAGDRIDLELPMEPQRVKADDHIKADQGRVALRYGPLVYNVERADQPNLDQPLGPAPLKAEWRPDLLGGVMALTGTWADGKPMLAIPNYARMNRVGQRPPETAASMTGGVLASTPNASPAPGTNSPRPATKSDVDSMVWIKDGR